ncbi:helix-turn-helix transcriptional regulator [Dorea ammoniilytica]
MRHDIKECGKRIQQLRKERELTQEQLAEKLNVSQNTIAKIESGLQYRRIAKTEPTVDLGKDETL